MRSKVKMQISELNTTIDSVLRDYDRFSIERQRSKENLDGRRQSKSSANLLNYMDFHQFNESSASLKKPAISSFSHLSTAHRSDPKSDSPFGGYMTVDAFQQPNKTLSSGQSKEMPKHGPLSASSQINSNCEKLSNLTFSARNSYEPTACSRGPPFGSALNGYGGSCLSSANESVAALSSSALAGTNGVMNGNLVGFANAASLSEQDNEQSIKTKELKKNLVPTADSESKVDSGNSFYCLSNLINTPNEHPISRFVCLWQNCSKTFSLQRDLVSLRLLLGIELTFKLTATSLWHFPAYRACTSIRHT